MKEPPEIDILRHTQRTGRYVTGESFVIEMGARGLLKDHSPQCLADGMHYFTLTEAGRKILADHQATSPKPPVLTRSQLRYREWLDISDCFNGNFGDWLRWKFGKNKIIS